MKAQGLMHEANPYRRRLEISAGEAYLFTVAAVIHDVGKLGRYSLIHKANDAEKAYWYDIHCDKDGKITHITYKFDFESHARVGYDMLLNKGHYIMVTTQSLFNFDKLFSELGIRDPEERKFIAILVGMHFDFGNVVSGAMPIGAYLEKLAALVK